MATLTQSTAAWIQFSLRSRTTGDPILGIPANEVSFYYRKEGSLVWVSLALVGVADNTDPQTGENFAHIGYGVYAVLLTATMLNTLGSFYWMAKKSGLAIQDFQTVEGTETISLGEDFITTIDALAIDLDALTTLVTTDFGTVNTTLTAIQATLATLNTKADAAQVTLDSIDGTIPSGVTASFSES